MKDARCNGGVIWSLRASRLLLWPAQGRRTNPKIPTRGQGHMKLIFTALFALCTVAATFADEGKFGPAWVEGHNYKVVDGQLVDLGPAPTPTPRLRRRLRQLRLSRRLSLITTSQIRPRRRYQFRLQRNSRVVRYPSNRGTLSSMYGRTTAATTPHTLPLLRKTD